MHKYRSEAGSTAVGAPIVIAISMFLIALLIVVCVNILMPFIWYEKLSLESLKYIFVMEEYGYLTQEEKTRLINQLTADHFDPAAIDVTATDQSVEYGEPIFLNITYSYTYNIPFLKGDALSAEKNERTIQMVVRRQSVSKR